MKDDMPTDPVEAARVVFARRMLVSLWLATGEEPSVYDPETKQRVYPAWYPEELARYKERQAKRVPVP